MAGNLLDFWQRGADISVTSIMEPDAVLGKAENLRVKKNLTHIVCGILLRGSRTTNNLEVLLIQETGTDWYLPAGRLEAGESFENGMKREVKEEAGVDCESLGLVCVETCRPDWYRFTYMARYTGGSLKTLNESDVESLQAAWYPVDDLLNKSSADRLVLRGADILRLVRLAVSRYENPDSSSMNPYCAARTISRPLSGLYVRFIILSGNNAFLHNGQFPLIEYGLHQHVSLPLSKIFEKVTKESYSTVQRKLVSVEAYPVPAYEHDGLCLTILVELDAETLRNSGEQNSYAWVDINKCDRNVITCIESWRKNFAILFA